MGPIIYTFAFIGICTVSIAVGLAFHEFVLRPLGRYLDRKDNA